MYNLADYNGKAIYGNQVINTDYLVPSAKVSYIWDKIFNYSNFTYGGDIFQSEDFQNFWLSYPKPVGSEIQEIVLINSQTYTMPLTYTQAVGVGSGVEYVTFSESNLLRQPFSNQYAQAVAQADGNARNIDTAGSGQFQFKLKGSLTNTSNPSMTFDIAIGKTVQGQMPTYEIIISGATNATQIDLTHSFTVNDNELISLHLMKNGLPLAGQFQFIAFYGNLKIDFTKVVGDVVDFEQALVEFSIKDFVSEILQRFNLTMFKDKYTNHIEFLTLAQWIQTDSIVDWSEKFVSHQTTTYTYDNYAQRNVFKYRYDDQNASHHDGIIKIDNVNLKDENVVINSAIYSPNKIKGYLAGKVVNVYPFWNKEVKEGSNEGEQTITYKPLDNRYYFMRSELYDLQSGTTVGSEVFNQSQQVYLAKFEDYSRLPFQNIIDNYYKSFESIINKAKIVTAEIFLTETDIVNFDFQKLVYIKQLGSYFLVNKIQSFIPNKLTKVEFIKLEYFEEQFSQPEVPNGTFITITDVVKDNCEITINFDTDAVLPREIKVTATKNLFGGISNPQTDIFETTVIPTGNSITITLPSGGLWGMYLSFSNFGVVVNSNNFTIENTTECNYTPPVSDLTKLNLTSVVYNGLQSQVLDGNFTLNWTSDVFPASELTLIVKDGTNNSLIFSTQIPAFWNQSYTFWVNFPPSQLTFQLAYNGVASNTITVNI